MSLRAFELGLLAMIILFTAVYSLITPNLTRRDLLFGVTVAPDARRSAQGRRILARYRLATVVVNLLALGGLAILYLLAPEGWVASPWLPLVVFVAFALDSIPYLVAHAASTDLRAAPSAASQASHPAAELAQRHYGDYVPWLWELLPVGVIAATAGYLATRYAAAPSVIPIHFDLNGNPNGYATKSIASYFVMVWTQIGIEVLITGMSVLVVGSKAVPGRSEAVFRRVWLRALYAMKTLLLLLFAFIAAVIAESAASGRGPSTAIIVAPIGLVVVILIGTIVLALWTGQGGARLGSPGETATDRTDDRHWILGAIYVNRDDSAIFVERRFGVGWTMNFGNPRAILVLLLILAVPIGASVVAIVASGK
jgi:uncharacterized membrane protein